jgi:thiamine biosynthesis protein ThiS
VKILVNGEPRTARDGATIAELLQELRLEPRRVAVEVNFELLPRQRHGEHALRDGDRLEIVSLAGGG